MSRAGIDPAVSFDCLVAVTEACTNALTHGYGDEDPYPEIEWEIGEGTVRFYVKDFSTQQWSRASHPSFDGKGVLDEERVGGFGIDLMRGLMDEVELRIGPEGTTVCLTKQLEVGDAI
jgi:serine/threonine-protein kinase RsbW